ncbi:hypothetical protein ACTFIY_001884 [Dictyostelium cf. discoideum]
MSSFERSIKKKNNDFAPYTKESVKKDIENRIQQLQLIKFDEITFVDISKTGTIEKQLDFIKNNMKLFVDYNGFVLEKHVDIKKFSKGAYTNSAYLINGLVIIDKLNESIVHGRVTHLLNGIIYVYSITSGVVEGSGGTGILISANSCLQPDGSLIRLRQPPLIPNDNVLLVHEVYYKSSSISQSFQKSVAIVFQRNISTVDPTSLISFGSQQLTEGDINKHNTLSHNNTSITGSLHNNLNINNIQNNPVYMITITPPSLFLNTPLPVGMAPLVIDLFNVKQVMDRIPNFSALNS